MSLSGKKDKNDHSRHKGVSAHMVGFSLQTEFVSEAAILFNQFLNVSNL